MQEAEKNNLLVLSYLELRKSVGVIGILLPFVLALGTLALDGGSILSSVSSYYYSSMGNVFVGSLCAIGVFLWSYRGYDERDALAGHFAALCAIATALFPTTPEGSASIYQHMIGILHLMFAAGFFLTLAYFALVLFTKTNPNIPPTAMKLVRNKVYVVCGMSILLSILLIVLVKILPDASLGAYMPVFWLESLAIFSFGVSWLVKGEAILKD